MVLTKVSDTLRCDGRQLKMNADHFTIVAIIKKHGNVTKMEYSYVPYQWVKDNYVFWPPNQSLTLRNDPSSAPQSNWKKFKCKVKKDFIFGKDEAELWEEEYVNASCTESEETLTINWQLNNNDKTNNNGNKETMKTKIDTLFDNIVTSTPNIQTHAAAAAASKNVESNKKEINMTFRNEDDILIQECENNNLVNTADNVLIYESNLINNEEASLSTIFKTLQDIQKRLKRLEENQVRILEMKTSENSILKFTLDKMYTMLKNLYDNGSILTATSSKPTTEYEDTNEFEKKFIFPLNKVSDVLAFNLVLSDKDPSYKNYLLNTFQKIGGTEGMEDGKIVARNLLAIFFTKELLTMFSWTGISRTEGVKKEAFQSCHGIINFFVEIVGLADSRWNVVKNEDLFKKHILKHAKQINEAAKKKKANTKNKEVDAADTVLDNGHEMPNNEIIDGNNDNAEEKGEEENNN